MSLTISDKRAPLLRNAPRRECQYPRAFIKIRPVKTGSYFVGAMLIDISETGIGIITSQTLSVGTRVDIYLDDEFHALGEVVNLNEEHEDWNWNGMVRLGIKFLEKDNWPFN